MSSAVEPRTPAIVIEDQATAARMLIWDSIIDRIKPIHTYPYPTRSHRYCEATRYRYALALKGESR
jgi:hypothetical protein